MDGFQASGQLSLELSVFSKTFEIRPPGRIFSFIVKAIYLGMYF